MLLALSGTLEMLLSQRKLSATAFHPIMTHLFFSSFSHVVLVTVSDIIIYIYLCICLEIFDGGRNFNFAADS